MTPDFILLVSGALCFFISMWLVMSQLPTYVAQLGGSEANIGMVLSAFALTALLARPFIGRMVDRFGRKAIALLGCTIYAIAPLLYLLPSSWPGLLPVRMFNGLGIAFFSIASTTWAADIIPPDRRAAGMGMFSNSSQLAIAVAPVMGAAIYGLAGYTMLFVAATAVAVLSIILIRIAREEKRPAGQNVGSGSFMSALARLDVVAMTLAVASTSATWGIMISFLAIVAAERHAGQAAMFFAIYAIVSIATRFVVGPIADRWGRRIIAIPAIVGVALVMLLFTQVSTAAFLYLLAAFYGASFGSVYPTLSAFLVDVVPAGVRGSAIGVFTAGFDVGIIVGSSIGGILAQYVGINATFIFAGVLCLGGALVLLGGTRERARNTVAAPH